MSLFLIPCFWPSIERWKEGREAGVRWHGLERKKKKKKKKHREEEHGELERSPARLLDIHSQGDSSNGEEGYFAKSPWGSPVVYLEGSSQML